MAIERYTKGFILVSNKGIYRIHVRAYDKPMMMSTNLIDLNVVKPANPNYIFWR